MTIQLEETVGVHGASMIKHTESTRVIALFATLTDAGFVMCGVEFPFWVTHWECGSGQSKLVLITEETVIYCSLQIASAATTMVRMPKTTSLGVPRSLAILVPSAKASKNSINE